MKRSLVWWEFTPWDSLLFRDARPWSAPGGVAHDSLFPPPARTVAGAVRRAIADHAVKSGGSADDPQTQKLLQRLCIAGPYVLLDGQLLHRAPAPLVRGLERQASSFQPRLAWRGVQVEPALTDAGPFSVPSEVRPALMSPEDLHDAWLRPEGFRAFCDGALPSPDEVLSDDDLFDEEARTGHAGSRLTGAPQPRKLYSTAHLRLKPGVRILVGLGFGHEAPGEALLPGAGEVRLGGEGRLASFRTVRPDPRPRWTRKQREMPEPFMLYFRTPGLFSTGAAAQPCGDWRTWDRVTPVEGLSPGGLARMEWDCDPFRPAGTRGSDAVRPRFRIISACSGAPQALGAYGTGPGVAVRWLLAAGSVLFCTRAPGHETALQPGAQLGIGRELGLGEVVVVPGWTASPWRVRTPETASIHHSNSRS